MRFGPKTAFVLTALAAIFTLPRFIPTEPSISTSYVFGYNNRVGTLLLIFFLLVATTIYPFKFIEPETDESVPLKLLERWAFVFAGAWAVMAVFTHGLGGFGESAYLIDRINLVARGAVPYRDFEFAYGPAFLYIPRFLMHFGLSAESAYDAFWLFSLLSGLGMLYVTINSITFRSTRKAEIFNLICSFALVAVITTGANYSLFRFITASFLSLAVVRVEAPSAMTDRISSPISAFGGTVILLFISPEMAVAFAIGSLAYILMNEKLWSFGKIIAALVFISLAASVFALADHLGMLFTLKLFSRGAYNFPILPSGHILLFFCMCAASAFYVASNLPRKRDSLMLIILISIPTLFAALGRCDPEHVGFAAIGIVLAASLLISTTRYWKAYRFAFVLFFVALPSFSMLWLYKGLVKRALFASRHPVILAIPESKAPFGFMPNQVAFERPAGVDYGFFAAKDNAFTAGAVERKIEEIEGSRNLVIPSDFESLCPLDFATEKSTVRFLFGFPYFPTSENHPGTWIPLCKYITDNYRRSEPVGYGYEIWTKAKTLDPRRY